MDYFEHGVNSIVVQQVTPQALAVEVRRSLSVLAPLSHHALPLMQLIYLLGHPEVAVQLGLAARATVTARYTTEQSSTSYELLYRCLKHCTNLSDLACGRFCAHSVSHSLIP